MRTIPYGYRIVNGAAVIDEPEAGNVQNAFKKYASGHSLTAIMKDLGIDRCHARILRILEDRKYLGTDFYPAIIEKDLFEQVQRQREKSREKHAKHMKDREAPKAATVFAFAPAREYYKDPFEQAQYIYTLIEAKE